MCLLEQIVLKSARIIIVAVAVSAQIFLLTAKKQTADPVCCA